MKLENEVFPGSRYLLKGKTQIPFGICILSGPSGSGKSVFCREFAALNLQKGVYVVSVLTDEDPYNFLEELKKYKC